jgi:hypothetical protein
LYARGSSAVVTSSQAIGVDAGAPSVPRSEYGATRILPA